MDIKISIIVPVYNTGKYLEQCLESLVNQTLRDIEIICVNDGSSDDSLEILEKFAQNDARVIIINQANKGQSAARNAGLALAKGEYKGFLDSDDWAEPSMFEKLYNNAKTYDSDISMCSIITHNEKTGQVTCDDPYLSLKIFDESFDNRAFSFKETFDFIFRICVTPWNKIYRNPPKFVEGLNFEDNVFCLDALIGSSISLVREPLVNYRRESETSYSLSAQDEKKLDFFRVFDYQEKTLKNAGLYDELKEYFETSKINTLIYWYKKLTVPQIKLIYFVKLFLAKISKPRC